jgi:hypothetical protein
MHDEVFELVESIAKIGRDNPSRPDIFQIEFLRELYRPDGTIDNTLLDVKKDLWTPREIIARFLLLSAVLDQGPEITGVRMLLASVTNELYRRRIEFLHKPLLFFDSIQVVLSCISEQHRVVKNLRADIWAAENLSHPEKYNLFIDNSNQVLCYAVFRWGVPLALPLSLERQSASSDGYATALLDYLEQWESAEQMSVQLKSHELFGLGKSVGNKACHLFAKWFVSSFQLSRRYGEPSWSDFSFEVPYDSNAGRVLWRTGYFLKWASEHRYEDWEVIQPGRGKQGHSYIRVTNIRGKSTSRPLPPSLRDIYTDISVRHLRSHRTAPRKVEIQRIQHVYLAARSAETRLTVANFDDGLVHIGTKYCLNHEKPLCSECPINGLCEGYQSNISLISRYRT